VSRIPQKRLSTGTLANAFFCHRRNSEGRSLFQPVGKMLTGLLQECHPWRCFRAAATSACFTLPGNQKCSDETLARSVLRYVFTHYEIHFSPHFLCSELFQTACLKVHGATAKMVIPKALSICITKLSRLLWVDLNYFLNHNYNQRTWGIGAQTLELPDGRFVVTRRVVAGEIPPARHWLSAR
jgi:hypothetical protein